MSLTRLAGRRIEKVWGRTNLPAMFNDDKGAGAPIGEIIFDHPEKADLDLLVKYLFTSEKLSIQVHPDDEIARKEGLGRGKDEAWVVIDADPGATIGIGTVRPLTKEELRAAALDGAIEQLVEWHEVKAGDSFYSPARTVHAIGPGVALVEVQQNSDITYRLYDYGRPRELHLDEGIAAADPVPYVPPQPLVSDKAGKVILADGPAFALERWAGSRSVELPAREKRPLWLIPLGGNISANNEVLELGSVWFADEPLTLTLDDGGDILIAAPGSGGIA